MQRALLFWLVVAGAQARVADQPSGLKLEVRLESHLTSYSSRPGSPFRCVVIAPLEVAGEVLIPEGSIVHGTVRRRLPVRLGLTRERAGLELNFWDYETPGGIKFPLRARLISIDNAREEVDAKGRIKGVVAAANPDGVLNGFWEKPAMSMFYRPLEGLMGVGHQILVKCPMGPMGPAVLMGMRCLILRFPEPEIHLPPGTDMELAIDESSSGFARRAAAPVPNAPADLVEWLRGRTMTVTKPNGARTQDLINVAFAGSREELAEAFNASGWYAAAPRTFGSFSRVYIAYNGKKTYARAPVSKLLYMGRAPDLVFEKSLDTVTKRHHVRIWYAGLVYGHEIWLGAATHDTGVQFDRKTFFFTHRIDTHIDEERAKVSTDLTFTGCSEPVSYASAGDDSKEGAPSLTDGRIAVLSLQSCSPDNDADAQPAPPPPGNKVTRLIRRAVLEARNYILRDNVYYWTFEAIRRH